MNRVSTEGPPAPGAESHVADLQRQLGVFLAALTAAHANGMEPSVQGAEMQVDMEHRAPPVLDELPALISVAKAARVLGISRASAYRYAASDDLPTVRLGGRLYVVTARLKAFLDAA